MAEIDLVASCYYIFSTEYGDSQSNFGTSQWAVDKSLNLSKSSFFIYMMRGLLQIRDP